MANSLKVGIALFIFLGAFFAGSIHYGAWKSRELEMQSAAEPRVIQVKEVVGQVVGGPQIVAGNPLVGYAVYIEESKTWGALYANGCPPNLGNGTRVVMYRGEVESNWYTFLRNAQ